MLFFRRCQNHIRLHGSSNWTVVLKTASCRLSKREVVARNRSVHTKLAITFLKLQPFTIRKWRTAWLGTVDIKEAGLPPPCPASLDKGKEPSATGSNFKTGFQQFFFLFFFFLIEFHLFIFCLWFMMWFLSWLEYHHGTNAESTMWPRVYPIRPRRVQFQHKATILKMPTESIKQSLHSNCFIFNY